MVGAGPGGTGQRVGAGGGVGGGGAAIGAANVPIWE